jgi:hypothetical protein
VSSSKSVDEKKGEIMHFRRAIGALSLALVLGLGSLARPASAQTLTALQIERVLTLAGLVANTNIAPNPKVVTPDILAAITGGALEIRERLFYDPVAQTVTSTTFLVPAGAPIPTPLPVDITRQTIALFVIAVGKPVFSSSPGPSILLTGTVISNPNGTPFGNYVGASAVVSTGYTTDTPPKLSNVVCLIAGATVAYSSSAVGTLTITQPSTPGGGPNSNAPTVVIAPAGTAIQSQIRLDASGSTDPNKLALTYLWTVVSPPVANILNPTSATPDVQFVSGSNTYTFKVTVTNSSGLRSTGTIAVLYIGR